MTQAVLTIRDTTVRFGGLNACESISLDVNPGELFAMIGPNGAGKTTVINAITGVYEPIEGAEIRFTDDTGTTHDLIGLPPHKIIRLGIARTFQNLGLFDALTVLENLLLGRYIHQKTGVLSGGFLLRRALNEELEQRAAVEVVLDLLEIASHRNEKVGDLAFGVRKRVELGRALAQEPRLLLLDEPMAGMNVEEKQDMVRFITDVRAELDTTMMLIEHDMGVVMSIAERIAVLNFGKMIATGTAEEIQSDAEVIAAYLGSETDATPAGGNS